MEFLWCEDMFPGPFPASTKGHHSLVFGNLASSQTLRSAHKEELLDGQPPLQFPSETKLSEPSPLLAEGVVNSIWLTLRSQGNHQRRFQVESIWGNGKCDRFSDNLHFSVQWCYLRLMTFKAYREKYSQMFTSTISYFYHMWVYENVILKYNNNIMFAEGLPHTISRASHMLNKRSFGK